jgi:dolichol-phosphate mannosyltransferase
MAEQNLISEALSHEAALATKPVALSVIAPTYNEAENLQPLIDEIGIALRDVEYEIIICDDNSPDRTWAHAEEISRENRHVRVVRRIQNRGLARAVVDGFIHARGEAVACIDADLQHDPAILPKMLEALHEGAQLVVGSRYVDGGGTSNWNWRRRFTSWVAGKMAGVTLGMKVHDPMSGFFLLRRKDFLQVAEQLNVDGFKILLEIAARLQPSRISEVPYTFRLRQAGQSKLSTAVIFAYVVQLWNLYLAGHTFRRLEGGAVPQPANDRRRSAA